MSLFGWSYPPGCTGPPDEPILCEVCGLEDDCICPECPVCGEQGNPACYDTHGLVRTAKQVQARDEAEARMRVDLEPDYDWEPDWEWYDRP